MGAPLGVLCKMWMILPLAARYFSRREAMTFPLTSALVTFKCPDAYSFCASMRRRAESLVDAVEGGTPRSWRNDLAILNSSMSEGYVKACIVDLRDVDVGRVVDFKC